MKKDDVVFYSIIGCLIVLIITLVFWAVYRPHQYFVSYIAFTTNGSFVGRINLSTGHGSMTADGIVQVENQLKTLLEKNKVNNVLVTGFYELN